MDASKAPSADGRLLGTLTAAACHDLMNVFATFNQALGLMDDCLAADAKTTRRTFGINGGFAYRERFMELNIMLRSQLARAVGLTEALALAAHSVDGQGRTVAPPEALAALVALAERLRQWQERAEPVALVIGGPDGIDPTLAAQADETLRLSSLTLPHALARVLLAEQLYRAWSVLTNHPYHRA